MTPERQKPKQLACPECGAALVPSVVEIAKKLNVDEETAQGLREYLIENMVDKLQDMP